MRADDGSDVDAGRGDEEASLATAAETGGAVVLEAAVTFAVPRSSNLLIQRVPGLVSMNNTYRTARRSPALKNWRPIHYKFQKRSLHRTGKPQNGESKDSRTTNIQHIDWLGGVFG